ncbi:MAG: copper chaperone PCu(A)C [Gammaproteobacteria bacterium]|nr:copper chaperone PCu(A)C [Gammaproteobacteria bacterium]
MTVMENGTIKKHHREGVEIKNGSEAQLKRGALHFMFIGISENLKAGDSITMTLSN